MGDQEYLIMSDSSTKSLMEDQIKKLRSITLLFLVRWIQ